MCLMWGSIDISTVRCLLHQLWPYRKTTEGPHSLPLGFNCCRKILWNLQDVWVRCWSVQTKSICLPAADGVYARYYDDTVESLQSLPLCDWWRRKIPWCEEGRIIKMFMVLPLICSWLTRLPGSLAPWRRKWVKRPNLSKRSLTKTQLSGELIFVLF